MKIHALPALLLLLAISVPADPLAIGEVFKRSSCSKRFAPGALRDSCTTWQSKSEPFRYVQVTRPSGCQAVNDSAESAACATLLRNGLRYETTLSRVGNGDYRAIRNIPGDPVERIAADTHLIATITAIEAALAVVGIVVSVIWYQTND